MSRHGIFEITEQRLADQARVIKSNEWLLKVEMEVIKRNKERENNNDNHNHHDVVVITTTQLHSNKPELRFCAGSNSAHDVLESHIERISDNGPGWK